MSKNLPIKIILQRDQDVEKNKGGGELKIFRVIDPDFINAIIDKFEYLNHYYLNVFSKDESIPAVAKITLREDAVAKSHRPNELCKELDIIGAKALTELFVKITPNGINNTIKRIKQKHLTKQLIANLSTIESVDPIFPDEKITDRIRDIIHTNKEIGKLKVKLFRFDNEFDDGIIRRYVEGQIKLLGYEDIKFVSYGQKLEYFVVHNVKTTDINKIKLINGIKSIDVFDKYTMPKSNIINVSEFNIPESDVSESDIIIGIIDSGISDCLSNYIIGRKEYVPPMYQNREHGTFVASSILFGSFFDNIREQNKKRFKLFDVVAIPNSNKTYGPIDTLSQDDLQSIIVEVMEECSKHIKIWNLSLGTNKLVADDELSDLAIFCDYIQDKYNVQFIISAGNYKGNPTRTWPTNINDNRDRITIPADSVRAITVGSIALKSSKHSIVNKNEPSPFSRKGPGANYMVKPEVVDYGGNILVNGHYQGVGVLGLNEKGQIVEGIGTSYSTPKITYKFAKILDELSDKDLLLTKGFLIHDARVNSKQLNITNNEVMYYGFGNPSYNNQNILGCDDNEITLVFKQKIPKGFHLEMPNFPYPNSLIKNGKYTGEIFMTLVYDPILDERFGSQYCRVNFDASFGTYKFNKLTGELEYKRQVPLEKTWSELYEKSRIQHGFKWSPIKSYYRNLKRGIAIADGWKIRIDVHERSQLDTTKHEFLLIVTIRGEKGKPVYNDVVVELNNRGYLVVNLETRQQIRGKY